MESPFISVIIPTYNEAKFIRHCLQSLKELNYPREKMEIIVVDNGSKDETVSISREYTSNIYIAPGLTIAALRNFGAGKAGGEIYAFIDADCVADKDWLRNALKVLNKQTCITGSKYNVPKDAKWMEEAWFSQKPKGRTEVTYINSGNMIMPAVIFNGIKGFNELLKTGEDYELCLRAREVTKIISDDMVKVTHLGNPKTIGAFYKREIWHGLGALESFKHKKIDLPLFGTIAFLSLTVFQLIGLIKMSLIGSGDIFFISTGIMICLLTSTAAYRVKHIKNPQQFLQLVVLYYLYYSGRMISLYYIFTKKDYVRTKSIL